MKKEEVYNILKIENIQENVEIIIVEMKEFPETIEYRIEIEEET